MNDTTPTTPLDPTTPDADATPRARRSLRPVALGVIAGVAAAALASGGIALASSVDFDDDRLVITSSPTDDSSPSPSASDDSSPSPSASPSDDDDVTPSDPSYAQVTAAALAAVGGGTVLEVDRGDSPGDAAWKVEIRLANGNEAEVRLAADLSVLRVELDSSTSGDSGSSGSGSDDDDSDHSGSDDSGSDDSGSGGHGSDD